jgi:hypothetical protein
MLVRRRCVQVPPADSAAPNREPVDRRPFFEDVGDAAYSGGSDLLFEGP